MKYIYYLFFLFLLFSCKEKGCQEEYSLLEKRYDLEKLKAVKEVLVKHIKVLIDSAEAHTIEKGNNRFYSFNIGSLKRYLPKSKERDSILESVENDLRSFTALSFRPKDSAFLFNIYKTSCKKEYFFHKIFFGKNTQGFEKSKKSDYIKIHRLKKIEGDWYYHIYSYVDDEW